MLCFRLVFLTFLLHVVRGDLDQRMTILKDVIGHTGNHTRVAFLTVNGRLKCSEAIGQTAFFEKSWSYWVNLSSPEVELVSNPSATHDERDAIIVVCQARDGQVYSLSQRRGNGPGCAGFKDSTWSKLKGDLPYDGQAANSIIGKDSVTAIRTQRDKRVYVFARSHSKSSSVFVTVSNGKTFQPWRSLGGDLTSDVSVIDNAYTRYLEAFAIFRDGKIYRIWQWKDRSWSSWTSMSYGQPSWVTTSRPVPQSMSPSTFNGRTEVFALGKDGLVHHCFQTTCDMLNNLWGLCTWSWWSKIKHTSPELLSATNALSVGQNANGGNEVLVFGKDKRLYQMWQDKRGGKWRNWESIGNPVANIGSLPYVPEDLWWGVHFTDAQSKIMAVREKLSMIIHPHTIRYGGVLAAGWEIPLDELSEKDWIGVFKHGTTNKKYLDYRYVSGGLNPGNKPYTTHGKIGMHLFLPRGDYQVRYLTASGRNFFQEDLVINSSSTRTRWTQFFTGLNRGLGQEPTEGPDCVEEGHLMVTNFELSFAAFAKKDLHKGLRMLGHALRVLIDAMADCGEAKIMVKVASFAKDLIECTVDFCVGLVIDLSKDVYQLYKDRYELYADIQAATNSFAIGGYEQAAMSVGRLIRGALGLPELNLAKDIVVNALLEKGLETFILHRLN